MSRRLSLTFVGMSLLLAASTAAQAVETVTYTYDEQGRLVTLVTSGTVNNGETVTISIDPAGNRTVYTVSGS